MKKIVLLATNILLAVVLTSGLALGSGQKVLAANPAVEKKAAAAPLKVAAAELLDINSSSEEQLKKIPGIGAEYARKIIAGRPYVKKDQLKSRKIIPPPLYDKIRDKIIAKQLKIAAEKK